MYVSPNFSPYLATTKGHLALQIEKQNVSIMLITQITNKFYKTSRPVIHI